MTLSEFNRTGGPALSEESQVDYWAFEGRYLTQRYEGQCRIDLYALDCFFVEALYELHTNMLYELRSFSSVGQLDAYLARIRLGLP